MTQKQWDVLQADDVISTTMASTGRIFLARLVTIDHNNRWIAHQLNEQSEPIRAVVIEPEPDIWTRVTS